MDAASKSTLTRTRLKSLSRLGMGLLIVGNPVLSWSDDSVGGLQLQLADGLLSVTADQVPLDVVIREIAVNADLRLIQHATLQRPVSISIDQQPLAEVLGWLLADDSYQLFRSVDDNRASIPGTLWIFADGAVPPAEAMLFFEGVILRGTVGEKKEAIRELRRVGTTSAVQTLSVALGDEDARVRKASLAALAEIGGDEALAAIASASALDDPTVRARATQALAAAGGTSAAEYLSLALHDEDARVRAAAVASLGDLEDSNYLPMIRQVLDDPDPRVRERAVDILEDLEDDASFRALFVPE